MAKKILKYDRRSALDYAHRWAYARNPAYYNYDALGGDCTNFISQCLFAGARVMNYTPTFGWYYVNANNKSPSWTGVGFLRNFLLRQTDGPGPFAVEATAEEVVPGDVIQLSFDGKGFQHSLLAVAVRPPAEDAPPGDTAPGEAGIWVATHTEDADYRALSSYEYRKIRFLHIVGVRL